ncbi:spliceosome-associated protein CWC27 homolog isoform X2 [Mya arenaria]|uniref:spliceosome-associated protein CWC27 homolog isoform X2 n=1 Tax=Mya arenaria TaxID=6604 RepID=UPI0022E34747|nr:spliceosome-associated protein CWC27 homolog isoform X2 [Mya arenaria]
MSNIYIQEPPSNGKVLLVTSCGDIDIELWSKEAPKACRNFVQLCMEGYYDNTIFHRVVKDFIVQGGDPTGTGHGGDSVYDRPFKDEFHQRLRFVRRGLVAMANAGPNDNGSQFFFTMGQTPELMNKHTIFGKVSGNTVYNMLKLQECEVDAEDRPVYPNKIIRTEILSNPYDDIIPRVTKKSKKDEEGELKPKSKSRATKNFQLLSFGEEAEEDEEEVAKVAEGWRGKSKSSHDMTKDPKLSAVPAVEISPERGEKRRADSPEQDSDEDRQREERRENVKKKLKKDPDIKPDIKPVDTKKNKPPESTETKPTNRSEELKAESRQLKKDIRESKRRAEQRKTEQPAEEEEKEEEPPLGSDPLADFKRERLKYKALRKQQGKKGSREEVTLALLEKFKNKLTDSRTGADEGEGKEEGVGKQAVGKPVVADGDEEEEETEEDLADTSWLAHKLHFEEQARKVLDANISDLDRYEIHDPRNPLTKRRREESKHKMKGRSKRDLQTM